MLIPKFTAKPIGLSEYLIGYIVENRKYLGEGCFSEETRYTLVVNEKSMPNSKHRGCFDVSKDTIEKIIDKDKIKEIILSYCQGINHLEFNIDDLESMVNEISKNT